MIDSAQGKNLAHSFIIWFVLVLWLVFFFNKLVPGPGQAFDRFISSQTFWLFSDPPEEKENITIVAIDEESRKRLNLKWPWNRSVTAELIENISSYSPKVIGLDIVFSGESSLEEDERLAYAIASHQRVVLGYVLNGGPQGRPLEKFEKAAFSTGFVNKPMKGGILERARVFSLEGAAPEYSFDIEILRSYLGLERSALLPGEGGIRSGSKLLVPSKTGITPINYLVHPANFRTVPAYRILEGSADPADFKDRIVLVGATDPIIHDEFLTPLGVFPGVSIIGNTLVMFLSERFVRTVPLWMCFLLILVPGFAALIINTRCRFIYSTIFSFLLLGVSFFSFLYLRAMDLALPCFSIFFAICAAYIVPNLYSYISLLYMSNKLKELAVTDPLTGFYSSRYFLLKLDELLKSKGKVRFAAFKIANYKSLSLELGFEELKRLTGLLCERVRDRFSGRFRGAFFACISNDMICVVRGGTDKDWAMDFIKSFVDETEAEQWDLGGRKTNVSLRGCFLQRTRKNDCTGGDILYHVESLFKKVKEERLIFAELDLTPGASRKTDSRDMLEFITYDWEERNKEIERGIKEVLESNKRLKRLSWGALTALARAVDAKSPWTAGHSERVAELALRTGAALGLKREELDDLHRASLLHDIGKIGIPQEILDKPGRFTEEEFAIMRKHPEKGALILEPIEDFAPAIPMVMQHHEWYDGNGYPGRLSGEEITLGGRILAVVDVFDALISDRPYRAGMPHEKVIKIIKEDAGRQFDLKVVEAFLSVAAERKGKFKTG